MDKVYLVLDIGTSYIKCGCIDSELNILSKHQRLFPMNQDKDKYELDFNIFYAITIEIINECLLDDAINGKEVEALLITSQAQTFTAVDESFNPLCKGIVWLDERAKKESEYLSKKLPDFTLSSGFSYPMPSLYVSKLLWLKNKKSNVYENAAAFPLVNEFLVKKLTDVFYTDSTGFGMSGIYDYRDDSLNKNILEILQLEKEHFPIINKAAERGEMITEEIRKELEIKYRFPVHLCGNDQGASASGAGLREPGDININFGTAMVFYSITEKLTTNLTENQIAGKHPVGNSYFLLNFESDYGIRIRGIKEKYFNDSTYDELFKTYQEYTDVKEIKPEDNIQLSLTDELSVKKYTAGIIKYYLGKLKIHLNQIEKTVPINNVTLSGGMIKSEVWLNILKDSLNIPFTVNNRAEAGLLGAIDIYLHNNKWNQ